MTTTRTLEVAGEAYAAFERTQRGDETITTLKDDAPEWVRDAVYAAHGDFLPDDWRYDCIRAAFGYIYDNEAGEDDLHEFADGHVDVYTGRRLAWIASNLNRASYVSEAVDEGIAGDTQDIAELAGIGQYMEASEVYAAVWQAVDAESERRDEEA